MTVASKNRQGMLVLACVLIFALLVVANEPIMLA